jgi:hypothetical protein
VVGVEQSIVLLPKSSEVPILSLKVPVHVQLVGRAPLAEVSLQTADGLTDGVVR